MITAAVRGEAGGQIKTRLTADDEAQASASDRPAQDPCNDGWQQASCWKSASGTEAH